MAGPQLEVELKLRADDDVALDELARRRSLGPATLGPPSAITERDVYYDTADRRLAAARWACRVRARRGRRWISLKGPAEHQPGSALHRRPEIEGPVGEPDEPAGWPPSPARDLVLRLAGDAPLGELLTLSQRRTERAVTVAGDRVATLTLDRVRVLRGGVEVGRMLVVELEHAIGAAVDPSIGEALLEQPGLRPDAASKLERALEMIGA